jgi:hypothetical protein
MTIILIAIDLVELQPFKIKTLASLLFGVDILCRAHDNKTPKSITQNL